MDAGAAFTGGPNATFVGTVGGAPGTPTGTLNPGDSLTGTGTGNTLQIVDTSTGVGQANDLVGVTLANIQTITLQNSGGITPNDTINLALYPTVSKVVALNTLNNADTFTNLATGAQVVASGAGTGPATTEAYPVDSGSSICSRSGVRERAAVLRGLSRLMMSQ